MASWWRATRRLLAAGLLTAGLTSACSGGSEASGPTPVATETTGSPAVPSAELAYAELEVSLDGPAQEMLAPGAHRRISYVLHNPGGETFTARVHATAGEGLDVTVEPERLRLTEDDTAVFEVGVAVGADRQSGERISLTVSVIVGGSEPRREQLTTVVEVIAMAGSPPEVRDDTALTRQDERVTSFVTFDDIDPDGDLDFATLTIIGGGFRADSVEARPDGTISYVPFTDVTGVDRVIYSLCDRAGNCDTGVLTIQIDP